MSAVLMPQPHSMRLILDLNGHCSLITASSPSPIVQEEAAGETEV